MYEKSPNLTIKTMAAVAAQSSHAYEGGSVKTDSAPSQVPAQMPQIEVAVTRLTSLINSLEAKVETLEGKLHPILRSTGPICGQALTNPRDATAPLADELLRIADKAEAVLSRLGGMEDRIEL